MDQWFQIAIAMNHTNELGELIEHFFEYAYLVNYQMEMKPERLNLVSMVTECLIASVTELEENHLAVNYEEPAPIYIEADKEMVTRVLQNLIRNCMKHSAGEITVKVWEGVDMKYVSFENPVREQESIDVDQLFERFYTADKARRSSNGLGLSIVKLLMEELGGSVGASLTDNRIRITIGF